MNNVISFMLITLFCSIIFILIGVISIKKKTPVHFWSNQSISPDEISDITSYNKEVGNMWLSFGFSLAFCSILHLFLSSIVGPILFVLTVVIGIVLMSIKYEKIHNKYKK